MYCVFFSVYRLVSRRCHSISTMYPLAPVDPLTQVRTEGLFHPFFQAGAVTHVELGAAEPSEAAPAEFIVRAFSETQNNQILFSPEFTTCAGCGATMRGLREKCLQCGSDSIEGLARITQYISRVSAWNRGKKAELLDRNRNATIFLIPSRRQ